MQRATVDFETRSIVKLPKTGGWVYSLHPTTEVLCLSFALEEESEPKLWAPRWVFDLVSPWYEKTFGVPILLDCPWLYTDEVPTDLNLAMIMGPNCYQFEAHNAFFERAIWKNVMRDRYGWIEPNERAWRCSASKASAFSLPRALEDVVNVLELQFKKDMVGNRVMQKLTRPRKARKAERKELSNQGCFELSDGYGWHNPETGKDFWLWNEEPADIFSTWEYCRGDVRAERGFSSVLNDLSKKETRVWQIDQRINLRGFLIDRKMAENALKIAEQAVTRATARAIEAATVFDENTGEVIKPAPFETLGQREKILSWVESEGVAMPNCQGSTIDMMLNESLPEKVRIVLESKRTASRTSVAKYEAMLRSASPVDDRIRDTLMYHGAGTGRWTGKLVQPQNFVRGKMKDPDTMCAAILEGDLDWLEACYGPSDPMEVLSWAIRGAIMATPGFEFVSADYSAIEARGTIWVVEDEENLAVFRRSKGMPGIYREMAGNIFSVAPASIDKKSPEGERMRFVGKQAILGLGYGMGWSKFIATCASYGQMVDAKLAKKVISVYRERFFLVVQFWKNVERAAIKAVLHPGTTVPCGRVRFLMKGRFLYCVLPSGRPISYFKPATVWSKAPWGEDIRKLTYMTVDGTTHAWVRTDTWGGKLTENIVQGLSRDLMADAILRIEDGGPKIPYRVVLSVHDELLTESKIGRGSVEELCAIMTALEPWAAGFPLAAEGWKGTRYRK